MDITGKISSLKVATFETTKVSCEEYRTSTEYGVLASTTVIPTARVLVRTPYSSTEYGRYRYSW